MMNSTLFITLTVRRTFSTDELKITSILNPVMVAITCQVTLKLMVRDDTHIMSFVSHDVTLTPKEYTAHHFQDNIYGSQLFHKQGWEDKEFSVIRNVTLHLPGNASVCETLTARRGLTSPTVSAGAICTIMKGLNEIREYVYMDKVNKMQICTFTSLQSFLGSTGDRPSCRLLSPSKNAFFLCCCRSMYGTVFSGPIILRGSRVPILLTENFSESNGNKLFFFFWGGTPV